MYFRGGMAILFGGLFSLGSVSLLGSTLLGTLFILSLTVGLVAAAFGIANERKWGYQLGLVCAFAPFLFRVQALINFDIIGAITDDMIGLLFDVALVALLLHPMSQSYRKVWFR